MNRVALTAAPAAIRNSSMEKHECAGSDFEGGVTVNFNVDDARR
jgi:hypothetical protein